MSSSSFSVAVTGAGGSGAVTTGLILLEAMAQHGFYGFMLRSSGPQIRGGESAVMMRFDTGEVLAANNQFDYLLALDWFNIERFIDEIPLDKNSLVIFDLSAGEIPEVLSQSNAQVVGFDLKKMAKSIQGGRVNMIALGLLANTFSLSDQSIDRAVNKILGRKGIKIVETSIACVIHGMNEHKKSNLWPVKIPTGNLSTKTTRWSITGNEACGLGALYAGVRFVAAYPITPATEILEWMSPRLEKLGGGLLQAEDELASINMIIGSSFGGIPSLTATSGPGLSLMLEGIGLAISSETPVVVVNVSRGGPSTGIPTKSEQSDLNIALYGCHGDAPHLVVAPLNISDAVFTTYWATCLAEQLQTAAIVLSDQFIGQSRAIINNPTIEDIKCRRITADNAQENYQRYKILDSGVSPMSIPGTPGCMYTADGLEHNPKGTPSSMSIDHLTQLEKRNNKLLKFDYGEQWSDISGKGDIILITWGSSSAMVKEAAQQLKKQSYSIKTIAIRLLMPLQVDLLSAALKDAKKVIVIEQNQGKQLFHYLHSQNSLPIDAYSFARSGPLPFRPDEIANYIEVIL
ncbi:MAG: 2-oxoacid:acceptor oxidoreductase subunit alpha [Gammaproteobacteria bacterium]|nr:2-oxoacid:acceptor oxidoreductase subunit alpha [Gammaproteobacteria bacterium]